MSVVEFRTALGKVRYQPALPDGRRLYGRHWELPYGHPKGEPTKRTPGLPTAQPWDTPTLYRSKRRASRRASWKINQEWVESLEKFHEVKK